MIDTLVDYIKSNDFSVRTFTYEEMSFTALRIHKDIGEERIAVQWGISQYELEEAKTSKGLRDALLEMADMWMYKIQKAIEEKYSPTEIKQLLGIVYTIEDTDARTMTERAIKQYQEEMKVFPTDIILHTLHETQYAPRSWNIAILPDSIPAWFKETPKEQSVDVYPPVYTVHIHYVDTVKPHQVKCIRRTESKAS